MTTYLCFFMWQGEVYHVESEHGIDFFASGFWVDEFINLSQKFSDNVYWIPPHKIQYIKKIKK